MNRLRAVFGRLQWKLTLSYTLVTSAVVIVLLLALMLVAWTVVFQSDLLGSALSGLMNPLADELAPLLAEEPPAEEAVAAWLGSRYQDGRLAMGGDGLTTHFGNVTLAMWLSARVASFSPQRRVKGRVPLRCRPRRARRSSPPWPTAVYAWREGVVRKNR